MPQQNNRRIFSSVFDYKFGLLVVVSTRHFQDDFQYAFCCCLFKGVKGLFKRKAFADERLNVDGVFPEQRNRHKGQAPPICIQGIDPP